MSCAVEPRWQRPWVIEVDTLACRPEKAQPGAWCLVADTGAAYHYGRNQDGTCEWHMTNLRILPHG